MDNFKSYEFTFLYLINKCILLFKYIENDYQKEILTDIKTFINKLQSIFSNVDFKNNEEKKNKILEVLISYLEKVIDEKIYYLIDYKIRENVIIEVEKTALSMCENKEKKEDDNKEQQVHISLNEFEQKINTKIKTIFSDMECNIKKSLKNYFDNTKYIEHNFEHKTKEILIQLLNNEEFKNLLYNDHKIEKYTHELLKNQIKHIYTYIDHNLQNNQNNDVEEKIKEIFNQLINNDTFKELFFNNRQLEEYIQFLFQKQISDIYTNIESIIKKYSNFNEEFENKIMLLGNIFNENIQKIFNNLDEKINNNEKDIVKLLDEKINNHFDKNNFNIVFDKDLNEIQLFYFNELITSTKINIKGLIGQRGPEGKKGDNGLTPIIRKINISEDKKFKFIIQEGNNLYEIISDDHIPCGPMGIQGPKGEPGKSIMDLKWNQENVMRVDNENTNSIIFLKSLCIGDKSHCLKDNSIAIAGGRCYNNNSFSIGNNSKTLDSDSIALYGTCIGKKAFSYMADNVDENCVEFGKKDKGNHMIHSFNIYSKEINFDCDVFRIKTNKYENNKIKELEEKIIFLEKKIIEILKKI